MRVRKPFFLKTRIMLWTMYARWAMPEKGECWHEYDSHVTTKEFHDKASHLHLLSVGLLLSIPVLLLLIAPLMHIPVVWAALALVYYWVETTSSY